PIGQFLYFAVSAAKDLGAVRTVRVEPRVRIPFSFPRRPPQAVKVLGDPDTNHTAGHQDSDYGRCPRRECTDDGGAALGCCDTRQRTNGRPVETRSKA